MSNSKAVARFAAAERALSALRASNGELVKKVCDCRNRMVTDEVINDSDILDDIEESEVADMLVVGDME